MEEKIKELLNPNLKDLNLFVDNCVLEKEGNNLFLRICLDGDKLDLDNIVSATKLINPIIDKEDLVSEQYVLEVYGKSKGSVKNEKN